MLGDHPHADPALTAGFHARARWGRMRAWMHDEFFGTAKGWHRHCRFGGIPSRQPARRFQVWRHCSGRIGRRSYRIDSWIGVSPASTTLTARYRPNRQLDRARGRSLNCWVCSGRGGENRPPVTLYGSKSRATARAGAAGHAPGATFGLRRRGANRISFVASIRPPPGQGLSALSVTCVIGLQWGDEAKGKLVDLLTEQHDVVVRYQGGSNAGHTVVRDGQTYKLSLIPSGILTPGVQCVVTGGVVLNPASILHEIDGLLARGVPVGKNLMLSDRAHVIFPWHIAEDRALDKSCSSGENIGTTMRGIGPCYSDKVGRSLRRAAGRSCIATTSRQRIEHIVAAKNRSLASLDGQADQAADRSGQPSCAEYAGYAQRLKPYVADTTAYLLDAVEADRRMLFEGAQGALLDIDHGTFPFVTSSNSSGAGVSSGSGVPGRWITKVIGVVKAYSHAGRRRTVSDRAGQRDRPAHPRPGQRIRHRHAAAAALRLVRRGGGPLHGPAERRRQRWR